MKHEISKGELCEWAEEYFIEIDDFEYEDQLEGKKELNLCCCPDKNLEI